MTDKTKAYGWINARIPTLKDNGMNHCGFITVQPDE